MKWKLGNSSEVNFGHSRHEEISSRGETSCQYYEVIRNRHEELW